MIPIRSVEDLLRCAIDLSIAHIYAFDFDNLNKYIDCEKALRHNIVLQNQVKEALQIIVQNFEAGRYEFLSQFVDAESCSVYSLFTFLRSIYIFPSASNLRGEKTNQGSYTVPDDKAVVRALSFDQFRDMAERECVEMEFENLPVEDVILYAKYESAPHTNIDRRIFLWTDHLKEIVESTDGVSFKVAFIYAFHQAFAHAILAPKLYSYKGSRVFETLKEKSLASGIAQYMISKTDGLTLFDHLAVANLINNLPATNEIGALYANEEVLKVAIPKWKAIAGGADVKADAVKEWYKAVARKASVQELIEIENAL